MGIRSPSRTMPGKHTVMENMVSHFRLRKLIKANGINAEGLGTYNVDDIDYDKVMEVYSNFGIRLTKTIQHITVITIRNAWNAKHGRDYNTGVFVAALLLRGAHVDKALHTSVSMGSSVLK